MDNLRMCLEAEYADISFDFSAQDIIKGYEKQQRKRRAVVISACATIAVVFITVLNANTGVVSDIMRSTGEFLSGYFGGNNNEPQNLALIPTQSETETTQPKTEKPTGITAETHARKTERIAPETEPVSASAAPQSTQIPSQALPTEAASSPTGTAAPETEAAQPAETKPQTDGSYFTVKELADGTAAITGCKITSGKITIPGEINGLTVTTIGVRAFSGAEITEVVLSDSVTVIENSAFRDCMKLGKINLDKILSIGASAFEGCGSLVELELPKGIKAIGTEAFKECSGLKRLSFNALFGNSAVNNYGMSPYIFRNCSSLKTVTFGEGVRQIPTYCFYNCRSISEITFPKSLRKIGACAFRGCESLSSLSLPNGLTDIGSKAFSECSSLERIVFPPSLERIESRVFLNCPEVKTVTLSENVTTLGRECLGYNSNGRTDGFTVCCYVGSPAYSYAHNNGFIVKPLGDTPVKTTIELKSYIVQLAVGESYKIEAEVENPVGATTYTSSDNAVAGVSARGKVTALSAGKATITVRNNGAARKLVVIAE